MEMMEKRKRKNGKMGTNRVWFGVKMNGSLSLQSAMWKWNEKRMEMGMNVGMEGDKGERERRRKEKADWWLADVCVWHCMNPPPSHTHATINPPTLPSHPSSYHTSPCPISPSSHQPFNHNAQETNLLLFPALFFTLGKVCGVKVGEGLVKVRDFLCAAYLLSPSPPYNL